MSEPYNPPTAPPPSGPPAYGRPGLPWDREKTGNALVDTTKSLITAPGAAFAEMREKGDYASPIFYALILGTLGAIIGQIWNLVFGATMLQWLPPDVQGQLAPMFAADVGALVLNIVLAPIFVLFGLFVGAGIYHLFLLLLGATKESTAGYEGTMRVSAYASVANVAQIIPLVGTVVTMVWTIVLTVIGLSRVHNTSTGKALAAVLLPFLLCCLCAVAAFAMMGAAIGAAIGAGN
ncbi:MAG TPA: YIP1 family protein [Thermoanaerobaculia bacterium]